MKVKQIKNVFPEHRVALFNLAAWQNTFGDSVYFIGREVGHVGTIGEPDTGILKLFEVSNDGLIIQERPIWRPMYNGINLEDPRALKFENENLLIGLTAVLRDRKGRPIPFPAIIRIDSHSSWNEELPPFLVITTFGPGKNITPLDTHTFLFRPDSSEYHHKILIFSLHRQIPEKLGDIEFPKDLPWALWRIGTTMPPIWLTEEEALFIVHGITMQKINGQSKFVYSLGRAKLTRKENKFQVVVAPEPILTPDDFLDAKGLPMVEELHPEQKRVVYSCGGIIKKQSQDTLSLYVNVGDRATFEVEFSLNELKAGLFSV